MGLVKRVERLHVVQVVRILSTEVELLAEDLAEVRVGKRLRPGVASEQLEVAEAAFDFGLHGVVPRLALAGVAA